MPNVIISDSSCLITLDKIGELHLLKKVYGQITVTRNIAAEFGEELPEWIQIDSPKNSAYQKILEISLDEGEASAIALAVESEDPLLIIDEYQGRKYAKKLGLAVTGTLGVIINAKHKGYIESIKPSLEKIRKTTNFRFTIELEKLAIKDAGEDWFPSEFD